MQYNTPMLDARNTAVCGRYNAYIKAVATVDSPPHVAVALQCRWKQGSAASLG